MPGWRIARVGHDGPLAGSHRCWRARSWTCVGPNRAGERGGSESKPRRRRVPSVPARSTVHQVLVLRTRLDARWDDKAARGAQPFRGARRANELWQMDATEVELCDGTAVEVISALDDCSRCCGHVEAFRALSGEAACAVFDAATSELGLPESLLSDNGAILHRPRSSNTSACSNDTSGRTASTRSTGGLDTPRPRARSSATTAHSTSGSPTTDRSTRSRRSTPCCATSASTTTTNVRIRARR